MTIVKVLGGLGVICLTFSLFWFAAIGFFRNAFLGILTFFIPLIGILVVTSLDAKATLYPWLLLVVGCWFVIFIFADTVAINIVRGR